MYNFSTFDEFISTTDGLTIGAGECWDYANLIWSHDGSRYWTYDPADPNATNHGVKWGWILPTVRALNTRPNLVQVTNINDVKRGDIVVINNNTYGHIGFANEDYDGSGFMWQYDQNYGYPIARRSVGLDHVNVTTFLGAWRYVPWNETPPTPPEPTEVERKRFPWVLYARKLRNR